VSKSAQQTPEEKKQRRTERLRQMLSELVTVPDFARGDARKCIEKKARKWEISLAELASPAAKTKARADALPQHFAAELMLAESCIDGFGREAYRIPVALTGKWVKGQPFSITADDLDRMIENFEKRQNGEVVVDYDHASEMPEVAAGQPIPAAGWMTRPQREQVNGSHVLTLLFAPTERAKGLIEKKEYRYVSPAIDWGYKDKTSGQAQGATLTSVALTNKPFLDQLPALQLRDVYRNPSGVLLTDLEGGKQMNAKDQIKTLREKADGLKAAGKTAEYAQALADIVKLEEQTLTIDDKQPRLKLRKVADGPRKGQFGCFTMDGDSAVGYVMADDMMKPADGKDEPDEDEKKMREYRAAQKMTFADVQSLIDKGREAVTAAAAGDGKVILMRECVKDGVFDAQKAVFVANEHKAIKTADYAAVQLADSILEKAVREGRLLPVHRKELFEDVVRNSDKWKALLGSAAPLFNVKAIGAPGAHDGGQAPVEVRVDTETKRLMTERKIESYADAMRAVLSENSTLREEYEQSRSRKTA
jgi:phage I-like protein